MAVAAIRYTLGVMLHPNADFSSKQEFGVGFNKHTSPDSFRSQVTGMLKVPAATELTLFEGDPPISLVVNDFINSAMDYTRTGAHELTPDCAVYDDETGKAHVHLTVGMLSRGNGALASSCCSVWISLLVCKTS